MAALVDLALDQSYLGANAVTPSKETEPKACVLYKRFMIFFFSQILEQCLKENRV